jgi:hypothetical protein
VRAKPAATSVASLKTAKMIIHLAYKIRVRFLASKLQIRLQISILKPQTGVQSHKICGIDSDISWIILAEHGNFLAYGDKSIASCAGFG